MRYAWSLRRLLTATLLVFVEGNGLISRCEEDVSPLLQLA
eukprot:symbB.v1.2.038524.t1/scaffold6027.1/size21648/1